MLLAIEKIDIGTRFREEMGDLDALAENIRDLGLLQPIGITQDFKLVFGERRLRACRDILKRTEIDTRVVKVSSILAGEYAENEVRKDFTPSERVAIAKAMKAEIHERRGNPSIRHNCDELKGRTDEIVSKRAGFRNRQSYRRAKKVVENGSSKLVDAMDQGKVAISTAELLLNASPEEQHRLLELDSRAIRQAAHLLRRPGKGSLPDSTQKGRPATHDSVTEHFEELKNHRLQLDRVLTPKCNGQDIPLEPVEKRLVVRLLREMGEHLQCLEQLWPTDRARD